LAGKPSLPIDQSISARITALLEGVSAWAAPRRVRLRKFGLIGALAIFVIGLAWAIKATPELQLTLRIGPLLILLLLSAPTGTALNTIELHALSRLAGGPMSWRTSVEVTIYTSAANMLPLPGGVVTKLAGMKAHGVGYGAASLIVILSFVAWAGFTFLLSGVALLYLDRLEVGGAFITLGSLLIVACGLGFSRFRQWRKVALIAGIRMIYFVVEVLRYWLAFAAIGVPVSLVQSSTFVVASVIGAAVIIAPQGLGIIEITAALVATLVGVSASFGFIVAALQRLVRLVGLAVITAGFLAMFGRQQSRSGS
jgi:hypothetical protein